MSDLELLPLPPPVEGTSLEVLPGLRWVRMPLPFALDHVNLWLIDDGDDGWLQVDSGVAGRRTRDAWEAVYANVLGGRPVSRMLVTHFHPDHIGFADEVVARFGSSFLMTQTEFILARLLNLDTTDRMRETWRDFYRRAGLEDAWVEEAGARSAAYAKGVPALPTRHHRLKDGDHLSIGGRRWEIIIGRGHSPEHACLWCAELQVLIAGDQVLPRISPNVSVWPLEPDADPLGDFLATLASLQDRLPAEVLVLPSHGQPFRRLHLRLQELARHHEERLSLARDACRDAPRTGADLVRALFPRALNPHEMSFALGEAIAHLNRLRFDGLLDRQTGADGVDRWLVIT